MHMCPCTVVCVWGVNSGTWWWCHSPQRRSQWATQQCSTHESSPAPVMKQTLQQSPLVYTSEKFRNTFLNAPLTATFPFTCAGSYVKHQVCSKQGLRENEGVLTGCPRVDVREKSEEQGILRSTHILHHVCVWSYSRVKALHCVIYVQRINPTHGLCDA